MHCHPVCTICVSFLLPDSTTSMWGFNVKDCVNDVVAEHFAKTVRNKFLSAGPEIVW